MRYINQKKENLNNYDFLTTEQIKNLNPEIREIQRQEGF